MPQMILQIGSLDVTTYIATGGYKWSQNDIDSPNSGRDDNGKMRRKVIARKDKLEITCRRLSAAQASALFNALKKKTVTVTYYLPEDRTQRTSTFYNSSRSVGVEQEINGVVTYDEIGFNLIEV